MVDEDGFKKIFAQFFPLGDASKYAHYVFNTFKHNHQGQISFEWIFGLYDVNHDGFISKKEMEDVVRAIYEMLGRSTNPPMDEAAPRHHVDKVFRLIDSNNDGTITIEELAAFISQDETALQSLSMMDTVLYTRPPHPLITRPSLSNP
ncbi:hypothetical protein HAZT_HAZT007565 [Hyalella azteca]|uniref:EF-hand domain-containing protein n=1 Tax=Hyalella azteca TaxID=294128 RepID=A0A6A0H9P5_HYAAZ|nr:hypothetical protein HAZT_HAZT007565 [Hyalella azteca]